MLCNFNAVIEKTLGSGLIECRGVTGGWARWAEQKAPPGSSGDAPHYVLEGGHQNLRLG